MLQDQIKKIEAEGEKDLSAVKTTAELQTWEIKYLGRKSELNNLLKSLKDLPQEEKRVVGQLGNAVKQTLIKVFQETQEKFLEKSFDFEKERVDVTAPGIGAPLGHLHPITQLEERIEDIFTSMGFDIADGPEVESEWYNFDALNFPKDHPARDMQDTFWLALPKTFVGGLASPKLLVGGEGGLKNKERYLMRTHTTNVQVRYMKKNEPPFRIIMPGRVFRNEATDASHEHTFNQFDCLMVDEEGKVSVATFKYIAETFFSEFFGKKVNVRLRPSFFPFTEPGFEFDISCLFCNMKGCSICKQSGWLEIGGAGMVNQKVFEAAGYPRGKYQGFAWGFGVTRLAMMKYKISDIRLFMSGDLRFIRQF